MAEAAAIKIGASVVSAVLQPMVDKAASIVLEECDNVFCIKKEIDKLQHTLPLIEKVLEDAEERQLRETKIWQWLKQLKTISYDATDVLDDFVTYTAIRKGQAEEGIGQGRQLRCCIFPCFKRSCSTPLFRRRVAHRIRDITKRLDDIARQREILKLVESGGIDRAVTIVGRPVVGPSVNRQQFVLLGRDKPKEEIMAKLLDPDDHVHLVPIVGMGGVGKTTLARAVFNDERIKDEKFPVKNRRWLSVGEKFDAHELIKKIIEEPDTKDELDRLQRKLEEKYREERFLLVLDDVWTNTGWETLWNPLTGAKKGGVVIVTTRIGEVIASTSNEVPSRLERLSDEDCLSIFEKHAFAGRNPTEQPNLRAIGRKIVEKLNGLPLAAEVVGSSLRNESDEKAWRSFLTTHDWKPNGKDEIIPALEWSYRRLLPCLKQCFAYCSVFPKDYVFHEGALICMWIAELKHLAQLRGHLEMFNLENVKSKEEALQVALQDKLYLNSLSLSWDHPESTRDDVCSTDTEVLEALQPPPNITELTIIGYMGQRSPDWMLEGERNLPSLQSVRLYSCSRLENLPPLGELASLKSLFIGDMPECVDWVGADVPCLEELQMADCPKLSALPPLPPNLKVLRIINIGVHGCLPGIWGCSGATHDNCSSLSEVKISDCPKLTSLGEGFLCHLSALKALHIGECEGLTSLTLKALPSLENLGIDGCSNIIDIHLGVGVAESIKVIKLRECPVLTAVSVGSATSMSLSEMESRCPTTLVVPCLVTLDIFGCEELVSLGFGLQDLISIEKLDIWGCPKLTFAAKIEEEDISLPSSSTATSPLSKLKYLRIDGNGMILEDVLQHGLKSLEEMSIIKLDHASFGRELQWRRLTSLAELEFRSCRNLRSLPAELATLPSLRQLGIYNCPEIQSLPDDGLPLSLQELRISGCPVLVERCWEEGGPDWPKIKHILHKIIVEDL